MKDLTDNEINQILKTESLLKFDFKEFYNDMIFSIPSTKVYINNTTYNVVI